MDMWYNEIGIRALNWNTGIYVRISEEERIKSIGDSIENQKQILSAYAKRNELKIVNIFSDEGQKGGNFNRPAFQEMIAEIEKGNINCVLVKDLSRFGREHIEGDYYLEKYFPTKGIRFISVLERIDSVANPERMSSIEVPLINLFNEQYLKQVSNATKASLKIKRKEGKFVGSIVPYGYLRSPEDRYKLAIDKDVRHIVEEIFYLYQNYTSFSEIARLLNQKQILCPSAYRCKFKGREIKNNTYWSVNSVKNILMQPIYTGDMVQGRSYSYNHKIRKRKPLPKEQWTVVKNTHEPIIDKETFERVQSLINKHSCPTKRKHNTSPSILAGYLVCKDCGKKMQRNIVYSSNKKYYNFLCSTYKKLGTNACASHLISENVVLDILLTTINTIVKSVVDIEQAVIKNNSETINKTVTKINHELYSNKAELDKIQSLKVGLYSDYKEDVLSLEDYKEMKKRFENKECQINQNIIQLEEQIKALKNGRGLDSKVINLYKNYMGIDNLNREIVGNLVN